VHLSEVEALAKLSAAGINQATPLSSVPNNAAHASFIRDQIQKTDDESSVMGLLHLTQEGVGRLAKKTVGPSERLSEAFKGTCTAGLTEEILALALCNKFLLLLGESAEDRRQVLQCFNGHTAANEFASSTSARMVSAKAAKNVTSKRFALYNVLVPPPVTADIFFELFRLRISNRRHLSGSDPQCGLRA